MFQDIPVPMESFPCVISAVGETRPVAATVGPHLKRLLAVARASCKEKALVSH